MSLRLWNLKRPQVACHGIETCAQSFVGVASDGALGAFVVFCMAVLKDMKWAELKSALLETAKLT
ncbi:hypothetical protein [Leisingera sp. MMG026]|uniref:hypothetical protein n=1 Tax=Leisingera sp. MMG026 TaxID=2909982 RepID=UPI001F355E9F|nr:hypothetical protein [Leisingera sp. MMG026]MCF6433045.1 hypothetical protein [Leisingera sp. MMG026]